jgi:hypothetical protein
MSANRTANIIDFVNLSTMDILLLLQPSFTEAGIARS